MSIFDRAERLMSRNGGRFSAELVLITPMRTGKIAISEDTSRPPFSVMGTLNVRSSARRPLGEGNTAGDVGMIMAPDNSLSIELRLLEGKPPIRNGDRVTAIKRDGRPVFVISQEVPLGITEKTWVLLPDEGESE